MEYRGLNINCFRNCLKPKNLRKEPDGITNPYSLAKSICDNVNFSENCDLSINDDRISEDTDSNDVSIILKLNFLQRYRYYSVNTNKK